tara:strand:+ start:1263 stop:1628 length:366 start_codon:yes stop_codon:yes gene_type:complete
MKLLTKSIEKKLIKQQLETDDASRAKHKPYLKLFNPCGDATWLLSEYNPEDEMFYGLCDLGMGSPELGYVSLYEIMAIKLPFGLGIERDMYFNPDRTLLEYCKLADECHDITSVHDYRNKL